MRYNAGIKDIELELKYRVVPGSNVNQPCGLLRCSNLDFTFNDEKKYQVNYYSVFNITNST